MTYIVAGRYSKETCKEALNCVTRGVSLELAERAMLAAIQSGEWECLAIAEDVEPEEVTP